MEWPLLAAGSVPSGKEQIDSGWQCCIAPWSWQVLRLSHMCFAQSFKSPLNFHWLEVAELKTELCPGFDQQIEAQVLLWLKGTCINLAWEICRTHFCQEALSTCCFILGHNVMSHFFVNVLALYLWDLAWTFLWKVKMVTRLTVLALFSKLFLHFNIIKMLIFLSY